MRDDRFGKRFSAALVLCTALLNPSMCQAGAETRMDAVAFQRALGGTWVGDGTTLVVDTQRLQVNLDPDKPFEWKSLQFVNVSGRMVVFDVGRMRYIALMVDPRTITLTSPGFVGERSLHRQDR